MVTDALRRRLYDAASRTWGPEEAEALMELLPPAGWNDLVRQADLREAVATLRGEMADLRSELRAEIVGVEGKVAGLKGEIAELRGEIRAQLPRLIAANIGSMLGVAALVAAIMRIG